MARRLFWAVAVLALGLVTAVTAAPVPEEDRVDIDLRRTTLVVRNMETSLALYRDTLGLKVIYDNLITTPRDAGSVDAAERALRLVFLRANDDFVGVLGLLHYIKPEKTRARADDAFQPGTPVLLFNTRNLDEKFARVRALEGVKVLSEPSLTSYPSYDGTSTISVKVSVFYDPDGFVVELNELQEDLK